MRSAYAEFDDVFVGRGRDPEEADISAAAELAEAVASSPEVFGAAFIDALDVVDEAALRSHELAVVIG